MEHNRKVTTTTEHTIKVSKFDIISWLRDRGELPRIKPDNLEVTITVPSGADYSGDDLDLDDVGGITITYEETING